MSFAVTDNKISKVLKYFCRHLVGFSWYEGFANEQSKYIREPVAYLSSGFIIEIHDKWLLMTSGHMFKDHDERMQQSGYQTTKTYVFDHWSTMATIPEPLYFDFFDREAVAPYIFVDYDLGVDFALIGMPHYIDAALTQTIKPFVRQNWNYTAGMDFDFYGMLGLPRDRAIQQRTSSSIFTVPTPSLILLDPLDWPHVDVKETSLPQFVGKIHRSSDNKDVVGMSGGPILGFKHDGNGELRYYPVAIQSRWRESKRIVVGTPLSMVCAYMEKITEEAFLESRD